MYCPVAFVLSQYPQAVLRNGNRIFRKDGGFYDTNDTG